MKLNQAQALSWSNSEHVDSRLKNYLENRNAQVSGIRYRLMTGLMGLDELIFYPVLNLKLAGVTEDGMYEKNIRS